MLLPLGKGFGLSGAKMRNRAVELHDSEVATIFYFYGVAVLVFSHAYIHQSEGSPGRDAGSGWWQRAELVIQNATEIELPEVWSCEVSDGSLYLDGSSTATCSPVLYRRTRARRSDFRFGMLMVITALLRLQVERHSSHYSESRSMPKSSPAWAE